MKVTFISDTHCQHNLLTEDILDISPDLIIHCGDVCNSRNLLDNRKEKENFIDWYCSLKVQHKILIPGNHDLSLEQDKGVPKTIKLLINNSCTIEGRKIWGSPYTPTFGLGWAFNRARSKMNDIWNLIPSDIDILATHGPSKYHLDLATDLDTNELVQVGCNSLYKKTLEFNNLVHSSGHIHSCLKNNIINHGVLIRNGNTYINCSIVNDRVDKVNPPITIEL